MISYHAFGLHINASGAIPMLTPLENGQADGEAELMVWLQSRPKLEGEGVRTFPPEGCNPAQPGRTVTWYPKPNCTRVHYPDDTEFYIDGDNRTIWANWSEPWTADDMSTYLLGPILGYVLRRMGRVALHASSIASGQHACAFLGSAGAGKSTTAAAFAQKNVPVLADDLSALEERHSTFWVQPSYGHLRLWPESSEMLFGSREALPLITPNWNKRDVDLASQDRFCREPRQLSMIYWLAPRTADPRAPFVEPLDPVDQMMRLVENSYGNVLLDRELRTKEFVTLGRLLKTVEVRKLVPHISPDRLSHMLDLVLDDSANSRT